MSPKVIQIKLSLKFKKLENFSVEFFIKKI